MDGAGYFSSLNGDLRKLLGFSDTSGFFQIRSAPIRLRRELQKIGFLTPLEVEHGVVLTDGRKSSVFSLLKKDGYKENEISRVWESCLNRDLLRTKDEKRYSISDARRDMVRRYFLLDLTAINGGSVSRKSISGKSLISGYGPFYGLALDNLVDKAIRKSEEFSGEVSHSRTFIKDIRWLCEEGFMLSR